MLSRFLKTDFPAHITLANLIGFALTFLSIPLIARSIGPEGRGETAAALAAFAIAPTLLAMGVPLELRRRSSSALDKEAVRAARDLVLLSVAPAILLGIGFVLTVYADVDHSLKLFSLVGLALLAPVTVSWGCDTGTLMGRGQYRAVALIRLAHPATTLVVVLVGAVTGTLTPSMVLWASLIATFATGTLGLALCRVSLAGDRAPRRALVRDGSRFAGSAIAESASARLDQVLVLPLIGAAAAGQYSIASSMALLPLALGQALAADHFRNVANATSKSQAVQMSHVAVREALAVSVPSCVLFACVASPLMPLVFGDAFRGAVVVFLVLIPGSICLTAGFVASMVLAAQGRGKAMSIIQVAGLTVGLSLLLALGPAWAAIGAGVASSTGYAVILGAQMWVLGLSPRAALPGLVDLRAGIGSLTSRGPRRAS